MDILAIVMACVFACAFGMGIVWWGLLESWHFDALDDFAILAEDYSRSEYKARMDAYMARRELAELKGVPFTEDPPEKRVSVFEMYRAKRKVKLNG